ncbi:MAG: hypothetical protein M1830_000100 [Pleopsidium flavum]|nr:MAG: hypothetical protein M1830_000100 [Pleopsidium flavum]
MSAPPLSALLLTALPLSVLPVPAPTLPLSRTLQRSIGMAGITSISSSHCMQSGDSYTSTVFDIHGQQPNPSNPLGNPPYPGSTSCNGPNWVDFLTTTYNQSYIQTYNMAFGGAVVDSSLVGEIFPMVVQDLQQQVADEFIPIYSNKTIAPWTSSNSLFAIFIGVNDIGNAYGRHNTTLNGDIFVVYSRLVDQLYQTGARNFLFLNVPPIDRSPGTTVQGASPEQVEAADVGDFNSRVANMARNLSTTYLDTTVYQFDTNLLYTQILDNPASHTQTAGYKNTTSYCASYQE